MENATHFCKDYQQWYKYSPLLLITRADAVAALSEKLHEPKISHSFICYELQSKIRPSHYDSSALLNVAKITTKRIMF